MGSNKETDAEKLKYMVRAHEKLRDRRRAKKAKQNKPLGK